MGDEVREIARRIRELREICGHSVQYMARELAVEAPVYEAYEETGGDIPISVLYHMANLFGVGMSELLTGSSPHVDTYCIVRKGEGVRVDRYPGYHFEGLAYHFVNNVMEPMLVHLQPGGDPEPVCHKGQELNYVLEGAVELLFDGKRLRLEAGDSVYFDPTHPHGQRAPDGEPAVFLTVITE